MLRHLSILAVALLPGCSQPAEPMPHADAATIAQAVAHAQAQAGDPRAKELLP